MKKILLILALLLFSSTAFAGAIKKSGFVDKEVKVNKNLQVTDPGNKIIIIHNHGQDNIDWSSSSCFRKNEVNNMASFVDEKVNDKTIMVYALCTNKTKGDEAPNNWWRSDWKGPYKGKMKLDKRVDANLDLIKKLVDMGVPSKQIFVTGHSCGGWMTLMLTSKHIDKIGGGIALNFACYGKLSSKYKAAEVGADEVLRKFAKKLPGVAKQREIQINEIQQSKNLPILAFTHPQDPYDGLLSDWVEKIPGVKRIIISEGFEIDGMKCKKGKKKVKNAHMIDQADCFQYYNPVIKEYIASRIK